MTRAGRAGARSRAPLLVAVLGVVAAGCANPSIAAPRCDDPTRVGIVAQSVPQAAFVPCVADLPAGWTIESFGVGAGETEIRLGSDRADEPVEVRLDARCDVREATPISPRAEGVRSYLRVRDIQPRYAGRLFDVFPGGCVTYAFDFERGPHIALVDELRTAIDLYPRRDLRRIIEHDLGVDLDG